MSEAFASRSRGDSLRQVAKAFRRGWLAVLVGLLLGGGSAFIYSESQTPEYAATATLYVTSGTDDNTSTAYQGSLASQQRVTSYSKLVDSDAVLREALETAGLRISLPEAKSAMSSSTSLDTVLLNITATTPSQFESSALANAVSSAMTAYVARLETPSGGGQPLAKLTLVTPASTSGDRVAPLTARNTVVGLVLGAAIAALAVIAYARFSSRVRDEADIADASDIPVVASVPSDNLLKARGLIDFGQGASAAAEAFRKLRTNLTFTNVDNPPRAIVVTSAIAVEGKTTTAMNLAAALVEAGSRVVLVDADLRRPQVNSRSGLIGDIGLTNFLRGDGSLNDLVQPTQLEGLWVLASGPKPPNPAELLASKRAEQAIEELKVSFDYVIVDSPPVLPVTDAVVLSQWADGVLLVARSGSSKIGDLADAFEQISGSQTPVMGFVLTEAPAAKARYGYYAINSKQKRSLFGRSSEPKAMEEVLEPKTPSKH